MRLIDLHCDTILRIWEENGKAELCRNLLHIDIEKLQAGNSLAQFFAMYIDLKAHQDLLAVCKDMAGRFFQEIEKNSASIALALNYQELLNNQANGKISAFLTIEEGGVLQGKMENLHDLYQMGVRLITLTWNYPNEIGYPNAGWRHQQDGLTPFGRDVVQEMNRLGIIIDVSHLSDQGFYDVAESSGQPFVASHSNARSITAHSRNLTDEMIKIVAEKGGVIGLNFSRDFLGTSEISRVADMVKHLQYIRNIGGSEVIALGSDFDGISPYLEIEDMSQIGKLVQALSASGFSEADLDRFLYRNALRVIQDTMK